MPKCFSSVIFVLFSRIKLFTIEYFYSSNDDPKPSDILLSYSLSPVPHSLGTADGFFAKTNKAAMLRLFNKG